MIRVTYWGNKKNTLSLNNSDANELIKRFHTFQLEYGGRCENIGKIIAINLLEDVVEFSTTRVYSKDWKIIADYLCSYLGIEDIKEELNDFN